MANLKEMEWNCYYQNGAQAQQTGNLGQAIKNYQEAIAIIESMRSNLVMDKMKSGFLSNKLAVYGALVLSLVKENKVAEAFESLS